MTFFCRRETTPSLKLDEEKKKISIQRAVDHKFFYRVNGIARKTGFFFSQEFCKSYLKFENSCLGKKKYLVFFLFMFPRCSVHPEILSTDITKPAGPL